MKLSQVVKKNKLIDTHAHLHAEEFSDELLEKVFKRAQKGRLAEIWLVATDRKASIRNIEIIETFQPKYPQIKLRLGMGFDMELLVPGSDLFEKDLLALSDEEVGFFVLSQLAELESLAKSKGLSVDLIGEIGMDFYWLDKLEKLPKDLEIYKSLEKLKARSKSLQQIMFLIQLKYAASKNLPVSIHSRGAESECIELARRFKSHNQNIQLIFHSFTGAKEQMEKIIGLGSYIGINGIITYRSASQLLSDVQSLYARYPQNFLLETDSPYLIPSNTSDRLEIVHKKYINDPVNVGDILITLQKGSF